MTTVVRSYYEILASGAGFDRDRLRALLDPDLEFEGPVAGHRIGAEPFVRGVAGFIDAVGSLTMLDWLEDGDRVATLYDAELPGGPVRFAEHVGVRDERITSLRLLFDPALYRSRGGA